MSIRRQVQIVRVSHQRDFRGILEITQQEFGTLPVTAIVNAANKHLAGGGGVDGYIHRKAGDYALSAACKEIRDIARSKGEDACPPGTVKVTPGFNLSSKFIFHTVGPTDKNPQVLENCYRSCLDQLIVPEVDGDSIAFPCIATGVYRFPKEAAAKIAVRTVRQWLAEHPNSKVKRIIFNCYQNEDFELYKKEFSQIEE